MTRHAAPARPWNEKVIEAGAIFLLVFTPLAFGTVQPWSEAVAVCVILVMAVAWVLGMVRNWELRVELPPGWLPASLFLLLLALQILPLPAWSIGLVSPFADAAAEATAPVVGSTEAGLRTLSTFPYATSQEGLRLFAAALLLLILYNTVRTREQAERLLWVMVLTGSAIALFGIVQRMTWNGQLYWIGPVAPHAEAFGPFVNRAHFAGLMVIVVPMTLALWLSRSRDVTHRHSERLRRWQDRLYRWSGEEAGAVRLIPVLVLLMGGAALVSRSRGGLVALLAALVAMVGLASRRRSGRQLAMKLAVTTGLIVLAGVWIGGDILQGTIDRLADEIGRPSEGARLRIWRDALALWTVSPALGTGLGSFGSAFPPVRTLLAPVAYTHSESDWVQLLTETGAVGLGLALITTLAVGHALWSRWRDARSAWSRTLAQAGLVALLGAVVQGVGNYNLPITSNLFYLAAGVGLALRRVG